MYLSFDWEVTWKVNCYFGRRMCAKVWKIRLFSGKKQNKIHWHQNTGRCVTKLAIAFNRRICIEFLPLLLWNIWCALRRTLDCFSPESQFIRCILFVLNAQTCADNCVQWINYNRMTPLMRFISQQNYYHEMSLVLTSPMSCRLPISRW